MKHDMRKFYDGSVPFEPWTLTTMTRVKRKVGMFCELFSVLVWTSVTFSVGFVSGIIICHWKG